MKQRLDVMLVERGLAASRTLAQAMIMAGEVSSEGRVLSKPGQMYDDVIELQLAQRPRYVSRGGDKLASVALALKLNFQDQVVLDVGSSTGGFTDYALQHGATRVYAVDVGNAQLDFRLRQDNRVEVMERTDIRALAPGDLDPVPDMAVLDLSFVSLTKILPTVARLVRPGGRLVAMVKPQFETDKPTADRYKGVIRDEKLRLQILDQFEQQISDSFEVGGWQDSAVRGAQGNQERFYLLTARQELTELSS
jgi:23S rRNA (cytidine1920-2'-O)/16S rRNA (cytidine1409-2'-O)-methyltransferase